MKELYGVAGLSRQALHQHRRRQLQGDQKRQQLLKQAAQIRKAHPGAGCRKMSRQLVCRGWGRDRIEQLLLAGGYRLAHRRPFTRTTDRRSHLYYPNLIEGVAFNGINQVVQTDITYYRLKERFYYLVFLIDVYSRRIVGHALSRSLRAQGNIRALKMMIRTRSGDALDQLIHHSDRGSQYIDAEYRELLQQKGIRPSMCTMAWENAYTERVNRTIKEEYLDGWTINTYQSLSKRVNQAVAHYNMRRSHGSLGNRSPLAYEKYVRSLAVEHHPVLTIYKSTDPYKSSNS